MRGRLAEDGCARRSEGAGEPLLATAGTTRGWVVLEWPGTWSADPLESAAVPAAAELVRRTRELGLRLTLVRRHDRGRGSRRQLYLVWTGPGTAWAEQATVDDLESLRDVDLAALARGRRPGFGRSLPEPVFLVCTHGKKDPCCARFGRPAFRALSTALGAGVWESTHLGGDRFAANLVCLPHGLYFGRVGPADALGIANAYRDGRIELAHYRGRPCYPAPVQAADYHVRRYGRLVEVDALQPVRHRRLPQRIHEVTVESETDLYDVRIEVGRGEPRTLICRDPQPSRPPTYRLVDLRRSPRPVVVPDTRGER